MTILSNSSYYRLHAQDMCMNVPPGNVPLICTPYVDTDRLKEVVQLLFISVEDEVRLSLSSCQKIVPFVM